MQSYMLGHDPLTMGVLGGDIRAQKVKELATTPDNLSSIPTHGGEINLLKFVLCGVCVCVHAHTHTQETKFLN